MAASSIEGSQTVMDAALPLPCPAATASGSCCVPTAPVSNTKLLDVELVVEFRILQLKDGGSGHGEHGWDARRYTGAGSMLDSLSTISDLWCLGLGLLSPCTCM